MNVKVGMIGDYSFYINVKVVEIDNIHITIEDCKGNRKKVYKDLFYKYFKIKD